MGDDPARLYRARLEHGQLAAADALPLLATAALDGATRTARLDACRLLGDLAGRALGAEWEVAERAAFALLEAARVADTAADRRGVIAAMGRGFRNLWLLPFVHRRLSDRDETIAAAALHAAGGLGFPALEEAVAEFVAHPSPALRLAAIAALGRMGAMSAVDRLVALVEGEAHEAAAALAALTEIRADAGRTAALAVLDADLEPEVQVAAMRYLAELGAPEVLPMLRRLARHEDPQIRLAASFASRAFKAERTRDAAERFLVALGEPDRAVRAVLARRLRTLPVAEVIEQAEVLLGEDAAGVVQILGELRDAEITKYLIAIGERADLPVAVRARAIGSIEADQAWEREALAAVAHRADADEALRAAAVQAMGAFATAGELLERIGDLAGSDSAQIRGAVLWALQLARRDRDPDLERHTRRSDGEAGSSLRFAAAAAGASGAGPRASDAEERTSSVGTRASRTGEQADAAELAALVEPLLADADAMVRRRAAYVAGNLGLGQLAGRLAKCCAATEPADLRLAAYVALGELGMPGVVADVAAAIKREDDPRVLGAASNALVAAAPQASALAPLAGKASQLLAAQDPRAREAGVEIAGLLGGAVPAPALAKLAADPVPAVRGAVAWALGRLADPASETALLALDRDDDPAVRERAAGALLRLGTPAALAQAIAFCASDGDPTTRGVLAAALQVPPAHAEQLAPAIDAALSRVGADDPAFEPLVRLKIAAASHATSAAPAVDVDAEIAAAFPSFAQLTKLAGFDALVKSLRTAESLFHATSGTPDADLSPPITLWMKVLENYVHAWLGPRFAALQREPASLFDYVDRVIAASWSGYQRWIEPRWRDPAELGPTKVDVPLRSVPNAVRELQEHRRKRLDSPLSITEWARLLVLFAIDHPSTGFRNLFKLAGPPGGKTAEKTLSLAHRLHALAAVRNLVTHRASAGAATLAAFRRGYYAAFEDLVALA